MALGRAQKDADSQVIETLGPKPYNEIVETGNPRRMQSHRSTPLALRDHFKPLKIEEKKKEPFS